MSLFAEMGAEQLLLTCGWILWCTLHSVLISRGVSSSLESLLGPYRFHFRLLYNLVSLSTLLPIMVMTAMWRGEIVFAWSGIWIVAQFVMLGFALLLFYDGAQRYNLGLMLGLKQIRQGRHQALLDEGEHFSKDGSLGIVRHPWYLGTLLFLWSAMPLYYQSSFAAASVLSVYLAIGTLLEERKLVHEYGDIYRIYQQEVSMLFPLKWIVKNVRGIK